jgi:alanine dehydrogenase
MIIGVPKEISVRRAVEEKRVSLSPVAVSDLTSNGIEVVVEKGAGEGAHFSDDEYREAGASVVYSKEEAYKRTDLVVKVQAPLEEEWPYLKENQVLMGFLLLGIMPKPLLQRILDKVITAIGMELIVKEDGSHPLQRAMSKIAGRMAPQIAGRLLQSNNRGGRGILLGGIEGVPPADVVILGAGTLGSNAARSFAGLGATVHVMDKDVRQLEKVAQETGDRVVTLPYNQRNLAKLVQFADVLICAVQIPGERTPRLVTREMVKSMKPGSVLIDFAVDQGGASETIRLTPTEDMVYIEEGVTHFGVPNVPSWVPRTASHVLSNVLLPYLLTIGKEGIPGALKLSTEIRAGVCAYQGFVTSSHLPHDFGKGYQPIESVLS